MNRIFVPAARVAVLSCSIFGLLPAAASALLLDSTLTAQIGGSAPLVVGIADPGPLADVETTTAGPLVDGNGNEAEATSIWTAFPYPTVAGTVRAKAGSSGPIGLPYARAALDVSFRYGFSLAGPSGPAVSAPILFSGHTSGSGSGSAVSGSTVFQYTGGALTDISGSGATSLPGAPGLTWILDPDCTSGCGFAHNFTFKSTITTVTVFELILEGFLEVEADEPGEIGFGTVLIDPFIYLDPVWAAANPEYSLVIEPGVFNVPEPSTALLLIAGLGTFGSFGGWRHRRGPH